MQDPGAFLLSLYGMARELGVEQFAEATLQSLRCSVDFASALWGQGRFTADCTAVVPTRLHTAFLERQFLVDWSERNHHDPMIGAVSSRMGTALPVDVRTVYAGLPEAVEVGKTYDIRSFTVIGVHGTRPGDVHWLSLYSAKRGAGASALQRRWLECVMPHLREAGRINQALHAETGIGRASAARPSRGDIAVAMAATGALIRADPGFVHRLCEEWPAFDGKRLPRPLSDAWRLPGTFLHLGRLCRFDGRHAADLVFLTARRKTQIESLTARQLEVARLYARGLSGKQIAQQCRLSPSTVRNHLATIFLSLGVHGKLDMARRLERLVHGQPDAAS